ncbi:MAG: glycosyltransferase [Cyanobacteria bacterium]|nr:glycosyltransferase [Cyanobacteriota bacterium]
MLGQKGNWGTGVWRSRTSGLRRWGRAIAIAALGLLGVAALALAGVPQTLGTLSWGMALRTDFALALMGVQQNPLWFFQVPMGEFRGGAGLVLGLMGLGAWGLTRSVGRSAKLAQALIVAMVLALLLRYGLWRVVVALTLPMTLPQALLSGVILLAEAMLLITGALEWYWLLRSRDRREEANRAAIAVAEGTYLPSVDVLIPTYNEPLPVLRRTVVGCQAIEYGGVKRIFLLDDGRRDAVKELAAQLGCGYLTRPDNLHAKAGNLNAAIARTDGELIAIFDADFIPTHNFLQRTVGLFQRSTVGIVQTNQAFYSPDSVARNLGWVDRVHTIRDSFGHHVQPVRDGRDAALCCGAGFVVRRSALTEVGGFFTKSICEDYLTSLSLARHGYQTIYLNEPLSAGLSPESTAGYIKQQQRWAKGTLQALFTNLNPLTMAGLSWRQRLVHFSSVTYWLSYGFRLVLLVAPLLGPLMGLTPIAGSLAAWVFFFVPLYLVQGLVFSWLNGRSQAFLVGEVYSVVQCVPLAVTALQTLWSPFSGGFQVTPKGTRRDRLTWEWRVAGPLVVLWLASAIAFAVEWVRPSAPMTIVWLGHNLVMLALGILACADVPRPDGVEWFQWDRPVELRAIADPANPQGAIKPLGGQVTRLSEVGLWMTVSAAEAITLPLNPGDRVALTLRDDQFPGGRWETTGYCEAIKGDRAAIQIQIQFDPLSDLAYRSLILRLFCQPGRWRSRPAPRERQALWMLLRSLLWPNPLCRRDRHQVLPIPD